MTDKAKKDEPLTSQAPADGPVDFAEDFLPLTQPEIGESVFIRRLQPEQVTAQAAHFKAAGINLASIQVSEATKPELCRLIQRCLVARENGPLLHPGQDGLDFLMALGDSVIQSVATKVVTFQGFAE